MALSDFGAVMQSGVGAIRSALGTPFQLSSDGSTWATYSAVVTLMDIADVPPLLLEEAGSALNMAWKMMDCMAITCPIKAGNLVIYPASGDAASDRYTVRWADNDWAGGVQICRKAILSLNQRR